MGEQGGNGQDDKLDQRQSAAIQRVAEGLVGCRRLLFITGAGMSADSGLPTYRGVGGLYEDVKPDEGMAIEEALSGEMMSRRPELCWKYVMQIERTCRGARPNRGHQVIAALESRFEEVWVLTQNVDGFHQRAGSTRVIDIHGDLSRLRCPGCEKSQIVADYTGLDNPPHCDRCDAVIRPDVVLFGEMLPPAKVGQLRAQLMVGFDAVISIGTTSVFPYIAEPVVDARRRGKLTVEINPGDTTVSSLVDEKLDVGASVALDVLERRLDTLAGMQSP